MGVFGGKYMTDCRDEFPAAWFSHAKLSPDGRDPRLNYFGVERQPAAIGLAGEGMDPSGRSPRLKFQWYCRYFMGRRLDGEDRRQISRWRGIRRHVTQLRRHCDAGDLFCRPRQRQALLHWAYDSRVI